MVEIVLLGHALGIQVDGSCSGARLTKALRVAHVDFEVVHYRARAVKTLFINPRVQPSRDHGCLATLSSWSSA